MLALSSSLFDPNLGVANGAGLVEGPAAGKRAPTLALTVECRGGAWHLGMSRIDLDPGVLDHLRPTRGLGADERAELFRRAAADVGAQPGKRIAYRLGRERLVHCRIQACDHGRRCPGVDQDALPVLGDERRVTCFDDGRHVLERRMRLRPMTAKARNWPLLMRSTTGRTVMNW